MILTRVGTTAIDGVNIDNLAYAISTRSGRQDTTATVSANVQVPNRHGAIYVPGKKFDVMPVTLTMWVRGTDSNSNIPVVTGDEYTDYMLQYEANLDTLYRIFMKRSSLIAVRQGRADGSIRRYMAEVLDVITAEVDGVRPVAVLTVPLSVVSGTTQDDLLQTYTYAAAQMTTGRNSSGSVGSQTRGNPNPSVVFNGTAAPIVDAVLTFTGGWFNPGIVDVETGIGFYCGIGLGFGASGNGTTDTFVVDCGAFTTYLTPGSATSGSTAGTQSNLLLHTGAGAFYESHCVSGGSPPQFIPYMDSSIATGPSATGDSKQGMLTVQGYRKYFV